MPAIPAVQAVGAAAGTYGAYKNMKAANSSVMSYGDALKEAQATLDSLYNDKVTKSIGDVNNASAVRGFYGQPAADQLKINTIGDIRSQQASHVAELADQLMTGSVQNANMASNQFNNSMSGLSKTLPQNQDQDPWGTWANWGSKLGNLFSGNKSDPYIDQIVSYFQPGYFGGQDNY